jgi:hypothetical protein
LHDGVCLLLHASDTIDSRSESPIRSLLPSSDHDTFRHQSEHETDDRPRATVTTSTFLLFATGHVHFLHGLHTEKAPKNSRDKLQDTDIKRRVTSHLCSLPRSPAPFTCVFVAVTFTHTHLLQLCTRFRVGHAPHFKVTRDSLSRTQT